MQSNISGQSYGQQAGWAGQPQQVSQTTQTQTGAPFILRIVEARGLKKSDLTGKSDPYCVIKFKKGLVGSLLHHDKLMTRVVERNCNPIWNEEFILHPHNPDLDIIQIQVYDKDRIGADTFLGKVNLPVAQYWKRGLIDEWIPLSSKRKLNKPAFGELHVLACYNDSGMGGGYGGQQMVGSGMGMGQSSHYGQPGYGSSGYGTSGLSSGYGQSGLTSSSGYGTSGLSSGYGQSGLSSGYGTGYGTSSGLGYGQSGLSSGYGQSGLTSSSGYGTSGLSSGYGTQQRGISSGVPSSSLMSSSGYGNIPSSTTGYGQTSTSPASKEFSSGSYGIPYGSSHMNMMPGYGASHLGLTGSNVGSTGAGFVNYPPPVARHQDKW